MDLVSVKPCVTLPIIRSVGFSKKAEASVQETMIENHKFCQLCCMLLFCHYERTLMTSPELYEPPRILATDPLKTPMEVANCGQLSMHCAGCSPAMSYYCYNSMLDMIR